MRAVRRIVSKLARVLSGDRLAYASVEGQS